MTTFIVRSEAMPAWHALGGTLDALTHTGRSTPCMTNPAAFTSGQYAERQEAAQSCRSCPAQTACARFADDNAEPAHVWGGTDRTPTTRSERTA